MEEDARGHHIHPCATRQHERADGQCQGSLPIWTREEKRVRSRSRRFPPIAYRKLNWQFVEGAASKIRVGTQSTMGGLDLDEIVTALMLITERYPLERLSRSEQRDPKTIAETLFTIWKRILYNT